jgi:hypothetical protein
MLAQFMVLASPLCAQTPASSGAKSDRDEKPAGRSQQAVERVEPDIYYTRDKNGDLVPLLGYSLEDIKKLLEVGEGVQTAPRASFRIERLAVSAEAAGDSATLSVELSIVASDAGWVRVPLRLGQLWLTQLPEFAAEGEHYVDFDNDTRGYVAWFRGKAEQAHRVLLRGLARLESDGSQTRLRLNAPRAVFSEMLLTVPAASATGQVVSGGVLAETKQLGGRTQFRASGLANDFLLSWRNADARQVESPTVLSAEGQVVAHIDGRGVDTKALLRVSAFGREFGGFQVRLPRGATLVAADPADYSVAQIAPPANAPDEEQPRGIVEVKLKAKTSSPVSVEIKTRQGYDMAREGAFELGGFDVIGAVREEGVLAVHVSDDWQVTFAARQGVLQTDELPAEMRGDDLAAGFRYFGQPYSLSARVSARQSRTSVDPTYVIEVSAHHLQLEGTLRYHIGGAKVFSFSLEAGDWQLASIEPTALVNAAAVVVGVTNSVLIPLKQATTGEVELKIKARKPIPPGAETVSLSLPRLAADTVGSTDLVVVADDNVVLTPRPGEMSGLSSAPASPSLKLPARRQAPWYYRSDVPDPRFVAGFHVAKRRVTSRVDSQVKLSEGVFKINQKIVCTVDYEPAESLLVVMPPSIAKAGQISVEWRQAQLTLDPVTADESRGAELAAWRVHFPEPQAGEVELDVSYDWMDEALAEVPARAATVRTEIPLVMPGEGECTSSKLTLLASPRLHVELVGKGEPVDRGWTLDEVAPRDSRRRQRFLLSSSQLRTSLALAVSPQPSDLGESLSVERVWIQTWLTDDRRFDRAVFGFRTRENRLRLRLPSGRVTASFRLDDDADVAVLAGESLDERVLTLPDRGAPEVGHILEVTCESESRPAGAGHFSLSLPELVGAASARHVYWQLILPRDEYLVSGPPGLATDFSWVFNGVGWSRRPLLDTGELETWSGALRREGPLPPSVNAYLFRGPAPAAGVQITTVSRPLLVLIPSGLLLAAGLLSIYFPMVRRPGSLFVCGVAVLAVAALWPDLSLLAAQAAVLGAALVGLAVVLERNWGRRSVPVALRGSSSSIVSRSSTHSFPRGGTPAGLSTQTAALAVDLGSEAKT